MEVLLGLTVLEVELLAAGETDQHHIKGNACELTSRSRRRSIRWVEIPHECRIPVVDDVEADGFVGVCIPRARLQTTSSHIINMIQCDDTVASSALVN